MNAPEWISAIVALVALVLAFVSWNEQSKIKNLTDVVDSLSGIVSELANQTKELANQTRVLADRYSLDLQLSARQRVSVFQLVNWHLVINKAGIYEFDIANVGLPANEITLDVIQGSFNEQRKAKVTGFGPDPAQAYNPTIIPTSSGKRYTARLEIFELGAHFSMALSWRNDAGRKFTQLIECDGANLILNPLDSQFLM